MKMVKIWRKLKRVIAFVVGLCLVYIFGGFHHLLELDFYDDFHYPYDGEIEPFVERLKNQLTPDVPPINRYYFEYNRTSHEKCAGVKDLRLVYLIKSSPENFERRNAIRRTWGYEHRFSDVEIRTIFLVGQQGVKLIQDLLAEEFSKYKDIVQANFTDSYYNNTYKTMMGFQWAVRYCSNSRFYMFVDDDYYVSTKNVLRFVRYPTNYPNYIKEPFGSITELLRNGRRTQELTFELEDSVRLYTGHLFNSSPLRHLTSKWYVSLEEYPYHKWPLYITAGAYILSRAAMIDMYYTSYYTRHFRFDDIYLGLLAYKAKIEPLHCEEFYFYRKSYNKFEFKYVVASHGYGDPTELIHIWTEQKSLGNV